ncbi:MAG: DinB family protein [Dehalococcoidia bacterium]
MRSTDEELSAQVESVANLIAEIVEACPPTSFGHPVDEWALANLAGHVAEFPLTFARQAARLAAEPGAGIHRMPDDDGRLAGISRASGSTPEEAASRIRAVASEAAGIIRGLGPAALAVTGRRVSGDEELTAAQFLERYVIGHLGMHLQQAREMEAARV